MPLEPNIVSCYAMKQNFDFIKILKSLVEIIEPYS